MAQLKWHNEVRSRLRRVEIDDADAETGLEKIGKARKRGGTGEILGHN